MPVKAGPPGFPFNLNSAVDTLLKKEFDIHRKAGSRHPLLERYGVEARPVQHENLDRWRHTFTGIQHLHEPANLLVFGAIDDLWEDQEGNYIVVDYKATSRTGRIASLDRAWQDSYKPQMEIYQWLPRREGYRVSDTGYFVYCNGITDREAFDGKLEFDVTLIAHTGKDDWVEDVITDACACLRRERTPEPGEDCDYCRYVAAVCSFHE